MTDSKFNLIKYENQLVNANSSEGSSRFRKIAPQRDVSGDNFPNGSISFKWSNNATTYLDLEGSKLEEQVVITKSNGTTPLTVADGIALSNANNQFSKTQLFLNGHEIDSSEYCGEVDGWVNRSDKSGSWLNGFGQSTDNWGDYNTRVNEISSDGISSITGVVAGTTDWAFIQDDNASQNMPNAGVDVYLTFGATASLSRSSATFSTSIPSGTYANNGLRILKTGVYTVSVKMSFDSFQLADTWGTLSLRTTTNGSTVVSINNQTVGNPLEIQGAMRGTDNSVSITWTGTLTIGGSGYIDILLNYRNDSGSSQPTIQISDKYISVVEVGVNGGSVSGINSRRITGEVLSFKPMLGLWRTMNKYLVSGDYELRLTPHPDYYTKLVESATAKTHGTDYKIVVNSLHLKLREVQGQRMDDGVFLLDYCGYGCQPQNLSSTTSSQEKTFEVSPSTFMLGVAYSSSTSGTSTVYPPSKFRSASDVERSLNQLLVRYSNQAYPDTGVIESSYTSGGTDFRGMLYADTFECCGNDDPEDFDEWGNKRGMFVNCGFLKDASDVSTTVNVISKFSTASVNTRMLLFSKYRKVAKVQVQNGRVVDVQTSNN